MSAEINYFLTHRVSTDIFLVKGRIQLENIQGRKEGFLQTVHMGLMAY